MAGTRIVAGREVPVAGTYPVAMKLAGDLTIKDITLPVVAPYPWRGSRAMFTATTESSANHGRNVALETGGWLVSENVVLDIEAQAILQGG